MLNCKTKNNSFRRTSRANIVKSSHNKILLNRKLFPILLLQRNFRNFITEKQRFLNTNEHRSVKEPRAMFGVKIRLERGLLIYATKSGQVQALYCLFGHILFYQHIQQYLLFCLSHQGF